MLHFTHTSTPTTPHPHSSYQKGGGGLAKKSKPCSGWWLGWPMLGLVKLMTRLAKARARSLTICTCTCHLTNKLWYSWHNHKFICHIMHLINTELSYSCIQSSIERIQKLNQLKVYYSCIGTINNKWTISLLWS